MASVSLSGIVVDHVLPKFFLGLGGSRFNHGSFSNPAYQAMMKDIAPEVIRWNPWYHGPGMPSSPDSAMSDMKNLLVYLKANGAEAGATLTTTGYPATTSGRTNDPTNIAANGSGSSPADLVAWANDWKNAGISVVQVEPFNEPDNMTGGGALAYPTDKDDITWCATTIRKFGDALRAAGYKVGYIPITWVRNTYYMGVIKACWEGRTSNGTSWPYSGADVSNFAHADCHNFHPYFNGTNNQGIANSVFFNPPGEYNPSPAVGLFYMAGWLRRYFDASPNPAITIASGEAGATGGVGAFDGLCDVLMAIAACGWQAAWKLVYMTQWSLNDSTDPNNFPICPQGNYVANTRACAMRDLAFKFSRNYKQIVAFGQTGGNTPNSGNTDTASGSNAQPRLKYVVGLNADSSKLAVLVANADLSTAETFAFNWTNVTATGAGTYTQLLQTTTTTGTTRLPGGAQPLLGQGFSRNIEAGAAYLFEFPISGGTPPPPPHAPSPDNTVVSTVGPVLYGSDGSSYAINSSAQIVVNGAVDTTTANVVKLAYEGGKVWQQNNTGNWWFKTLPSDTWTPNGSTSPIPTQTATVTLSKGGTVVAQTQLTVH